jgi:hypothetical protein
MGFFLVIVLLAIIAFALQRSFGREVLAERLLHCVIIELLVCPPYPTMAWHQFECVRSKDDTNHLAFPWKDSLVHQHLRPWALEDLCRAIFSLHIRVKLPWRESIIKRWSSASHVATNLWWRSTSEATPINQYVTQRQKWRYMPKTLSKKLFPQPVKQACSVTPLSSWERDRKVLSSFLRLLKGGNTHTPNISLRCLHREAWIFQPGSVCSFACGNDPGFGRPVTALINIFKRRLKDRVADSFNDWKKISPRRRKMTRYKYKGLNPSEVRLLKLLPGRFGTSIYVLFEVKTLTELSVPRYEALSYTWGSSDNPEDIYIGTSGNYVASVTQNLTCALQHLRYEDRPRTLWIDAICVDQANLPERSSGSEDGQYLQIGGAGISLAWPRRRQQFLCSEILAQFEHQGRCRLDKIWIEAIGPSQVKWRGSLVWHVGSLTIWGRVVHNSDNTA